MRHRSGGLADSRAIRRLYQRPIPRVRWHPVSEARENGQAMTRFKSGAELCSVIIQQAGSAVGRQVAIDVTIAPRIEPDRQCAGQG